MVTNITGTWSAVVTNTGQTVYKSGATVAEGPVQLIGGATLFVMSGATASGVVNSNNIPNVVVSSGGTLLSSTIVNGYVSALQGATTSGNHFSSDPVYYFSGAHSVGDTFYADSGYGVDTAFFSAGSVVSNATTLSGGPMLVYSGATINGVTVSAGGVVTFNAGSVVKDLDIKPGGSAFISTVVGTPVGSAPVLPTTGVTTVTGVWSAVLSGGKTVYVNAAGTSSVQAPLRLSAGMLYIASGATVSGFQALGGTPTVSVLNGGTLINSQVVNGYVYVNGGGITSGNLFNSNPINYSAGASSVNDIFLNSGYGVDPVTALSGSVIINPQVSQGAPMVVSSGATIKDPAVTSGGQLSIYGGTATTCFLAGAMIMTPHGSRPVETLKAGDEITVYRDTEPCCEKIRRVTSERTAAVNLRRDDLAGHPVRVLAHAFGDNRPDRDLLVTAEHCFYFDGGFIPVRMLVNGHSVRYEHDYGAYDYYHVELDAHGIICANNVLTESYLDTRTAFARCAQTGRPRFRSWGEHGAVPLRVDRAFVEPIHAMIFGRCDRDGSRAEPPVLETDHGLYLVTDDGQRIDEKRRVGNQVIFSLPPGTTQVRLVSRSTRPVDVEGAFVDDRRDLGVLVGDIALYRPESMHVVRTHLDAQTQAGWNAMEEAGTCRWTTGHATLSIDQPAHTDPATLSVCILAGGPYCERPARPAKA